MSTEIPLELISHYLKVLRVEPGQPDLELLRRIVRNHLEKIPFENISKLYYLRKYGLRGVPGLKLYLDGIERFHFGGTCYSNNVYLNGLLRFLGFDADLCGADMSEPDVHIVNVVRVQGREYLVDVGYGAPFFEPMPQDADRNLVVSLGNEMWVVRPPDKHGCTTVEHVRQGVRVHGYVATPTPRDPEHFSRAVRDSFRTDATFMNTIRVVRFSDHGCVALSGNVLYRAHGEDWSLHKVANRDQLVSAIEREFAIPADIATEALADVAY